MSRAADFRALVIPAAIALGLMLAFFVLTGGWENLANPIPGTFAILAGITGFGAGALLDRRARAQGSSGPGAGS